MSVKSIAVVAVLMMFPAYVGLVGALPSGLPQQTCDTEGSRQGQNVGFCFKVSASVERDYYFGLLEMKTRVLGLEIDALNRLAAPATLFLAAVTKTLLYRRPEI
jgi:hypothetical protein